jgi:hypothetical protein
VALADDGAFAKQDRKQPRARSFFTKSSRVAKGRPAKVSSNAGRRVKNGKEEAPSSNAPPSLGIARLERDIELHQAKVKAKKMKATRTSFKDPDTRALMNDCTRRWLAKPKEEEARKGEKLHHVEMARGFVALSRRCVFGFWHTGRPARGSAGTIDVPVPAQ